MPFNISFVFELKTLLSAFTAGSVPESVNDIINYCVLVGTERRGSDVVDHLFILIHVLHLWPFCLPNEVWSELMQTSASQSDEDVSVMKVKFGVYWKLAVCLYGLKCVMIKKVNYFESWMSSVVNHPRSRVYLHMYLASWTSECFLHRKNKYVSTNKDLVINLLCRTHHWVHLL